MTPLLADLRIRTYSARHGSFDNSSPLREKIRIIDNEIRSLSLYSQRYKELSHDRFELNSYADALDSKAKDTQ